jgi:CNT family concentrative nucleoside transporter
MLAHIQGLAGIVVFCGLAWLVSLDRRRLPVATIVVGIALQIVIALVLLKIPTMRHLFDGLNVGVRALQQATEAGSSFVFGFLGGAPLPFEETRPGQSFVLAFRALPLILVFSALTALLTYWRVLPFVVRLFARALERSLHLGGAIGLVASANIFVGMVEAPLFVRPYLKRLTSSELFILMTTGMATVAGTVMVLYATFLENVIPDAIGQLLTASIISVPAAVVMARIIVPETESVGASDWSPPRGATSAVAAITNGTESGLRLCVQVSAMLVVLVALVELVNLILGTLPHFMDQAVSLQRILGWIMAPLAWLMGLSWHDAQYAGQLLGIKVILNEFIAYVELGGADLADYSQRTRLIVIYALSGFANLGSLGIMIGGLGGMVPERRDEVIALGGRAIIAGTLATMSTGAVVGVITL